MEKVRWGILGTAKIARRQLVPALQSSSVCSLVAVASRDAGKGRDFAEENGIPLSCSYEELLEDPAVDVVYIPLPNHLHVEWIHRAVESGKHVLCEKPIALSTKDIHELMELQNRSGKLIGEAYAILHQSRLLALKALFDSGSIGKPLAAHGVFMLSNRNPQDIRNAYIEGGGSLWDIGVYPIATTRLMFGEEPSEVSCRLERDRLLGVDHHAAGWLRFPSGAMATFCCGMKFPASTSMTFCTETHRVEIEGTYFASQEAGTSFTVYEGTSQEGRVHAFEPENQYRNECDNFSLATRGDKPFAGSLEHALRQTTVLEALFASDTGRDAGRV